MKQILHVLSSPRGREGESSKLSRSIVDHLLRRAPSARLVERVICSQRMPHIDADYAISQASAVDVSQAGSAALSDELLLELQSSDALVIGMPVHNYMVPSTLKAWMDHVLRVRKSFDVSPEGKIPLLSPRPVFIGMTSGGRFTGGRRRQPDFLRPYLTAALGMIGLEEPIFFSVEGTAGGTAAIADGHELARQAIEAHFRLRFPER